MHTNIRLYSFLLYFHLFVFTRSEKNESVFVPSREWQTIKKGEPIPEGLHVRHNFQTGITEAKLIDDEETKEQDFNENTNQSHSKSLILHPDKMLRESENHEFVKKSIRTKESEALKVPITELKARFKKIKESVTELPSELSDESAQTKVMHKLKAYEALKEELKAARVNITTDAEVLNTLFKKFQLYKDLMQSSSLLSEDIEILLDVLNGFEYLIHQIDIARLFADMEGISNIILPCLNSTYNEIKTEALRLLGAAVQSNPKVQAKALQKDLIQKLLHILSTNNKILVKTRCLFALSALVRHFPAAQKALFDHGGIEIFGKILSSDQVQTQLKVMRLINDLIVERQDIEKISDIKQRYAKAKQYAITDLEQKLIMHRYCKYLSDLMIKSFKYELRDENEINNYELLEVISESMIMINPICKNEIYIDKHMLLKLINDMLHLYQNLIGIVESDEADIITNQIHLIKKLKIVLEMSLHEEL
ncbi:nucleotide exchange factor SIL1 [Vespula squamosa]|uniref:Nucleotide exchange factor SIL1 n=1 Tax=Vespula squamosa TaxID=30214 RepID=A0ABD2A1H8_VESSQ